jgi:cytochrome c-type biogenesis protein CcmH
MIRLMLMALALTVQQPAAPSPSAADVQLEAQARALAASLRCPVCQGLSIQDSPAALAREMREVVREQLKAGRTPEQVKAYFVSKYGESVLLQPEPRGFNLTVYVLPVLLLIGGIALVVRLARKWSRQGGELAAAAVEEDSIG